MDEMPWKAMKTNYVLIDFENVRPDNLGLLDQEWIWVLLFYKEI